MCAGAQKHVYYINFILRSPPAKKYFSCQWVCVLKSCVLILHVKMSISEAATFPCLPKGQQNQWRAADPCIDFSAVLKGNYCVRYGNLISMALLMYSILAEFTQMMAAATVAIH